ncbi:MAG: hypothetical protein PHP74_03590 [Candidatus Gracilibacteria bacterium]|nr:hypothetical protein [Candidatus Gracilibacteria bacterium]
MEKTQKVKEVIRSVAPEKADNIGALMDAVTSSLLGRADTEEVVSARTTLEEAKNDILARKNVESVKKLESSLVEISGSLDLTTEMEESDNEELAHPEPKGLAENLDMNFKDMWAKCEKILDKPSSNAEFKEVLNIVLNYFAVLQDKNELPINESFYKKMIGYLEKAKDTSTDDTSKTQADIFLSSFYSILRKIEIAKMYRVGRKIGEMTPERTVKRSYMGGAGMGRHLVYYDDKIPASYKGVFGTITKVDVLEQKIQVDNNYWYNISSFYSNDRYVFDDDRTIISSLNAWKYSRIAENLAKSSQMAVLTNEVKKLNKKIKLLNVPKDSILKKFSEIEISSDGNVIFSHEEGFGYYFSKLSGGPSIDRMAFIHHHLMRQFEAERMGLALKGLEADSKNPEKLKQDPFLKAKVLIVKAEKEILSGEAHNGRFYLNNFLKEALSVARNAGVPMDPVIQEKIGYATEVLRMHSIERLEKMANAAKVIFGKDKDYKKRYLDPIMASLKKEAERIMSTPFDFGIRKDVLVVEYYAGSDWEKQKDADFAKEQEMIYGKRGSWMEHLTAGDPGLRASKAGYAISHQISKSAENPGKVAVSSWAYLVRLESDMTNPSSLRSAFGTKVAYKQVADFNREGNFNPFSKEVYPEIARMYYEDALGSEIEYQKHVVQEKKAELLAKYKSQEASYNRFTREAKRTIEQYLKDDPEGLKSKLVKSGAISEEYFDSSRDSIVNNPAVISIIVQSIIEAKVEADLNLQVLKNLKEKEDTGGLDGIDLSITAALTDMEGVKGVDEWFNFKDSTVRTLVRETIITTVLVVASMGVGTLVAGGTQALLAAKMANAGKLAQLGLRAIPFALKTGVFSGSINLMEAAMGRKTLTFEGFAKDWAMSAAMFMAMDAGGFAWERLAGKHLVGETAGRHLLFNPTFGTRFQYIDKYIHASRPAQLLRAGVNFAGETATSLSIFTGMGLAQEMIIGDTPWEEVNVWRHVGQNLLTILAMQAGNKLFQPLLAPAQKSLERTVVARAENAKPDLFLQRTGIKSFGKNKPLEFMEKFRAFESNHPVEGVFRGKTIGEVSAIMRKVSQIDGKKLSPTDWKTLAGTDPLAAQILLASQPLKKTGLSMPDVSEILKIWQSKNIPMSPEMSLSLLTFFKAEFKAVASKDNILKIVQDLRTRANPEFTAIANQISKLKAGTVASGMTIMVLLSGCGLTSTAIGTGAAVGGIIVSPAITVWLIASAAISIGGGFTTFFLGRKSIREYNNPDSQKLKRIDDLRDVLKQLSPGSSKDALRRNLHALSTQFNSIPAKDLPKDGKVKIAYQNYDTALKTFIDATGKKNPDLIRDVTNAHGALVAAISALPTTTPFAYKGPLIASVITLGALTSTAFSIHYLLKAGVEKAVNTTKEALEAAEKVIFGRSQAERNAEQDAQWVAAYENVYPSDYQLSKLKYLFSDDYYNKLPKDDNKAIENLKIALVNSIVEIIVNDPGIKNLTIGEKEKAAGMVYANAVVDVYQILMEKLIERKGDIIPVNNKFGIDYFPCYKTIDIEYLRSLNHTRENTSRKKLPLLF